ncbi:MAG: His/Gly/Thr/Pro-type tRNA ligase C-terminal domain-containing protein, partial [Nanoarchaeota archaeon]|nr:His/Gly/Thr/Pro-type tRNA ligase C-terminal domain-containing protein [Nanoarchaeota archaeon]
YGPKIDVQVWSAIGREFTLATNQVDFAVPGRFGLSYINNQNQPETPICIHRAPLGTHERFIGFLTEHYAGNFPTWLAPEQVAILPISDRFNENAATILELFKKYNIRASVDAQSEKIGKKIRDAEMMKIPYMIILGEKEVASNTVSVRKHGQGDLGAMNTEEFAKKVKAEVDEVFGFN